MRCSAPAAGAPAAAAAGDAPAEEAPKKVGRECDIATVFANTSHRKRLRRSLTTTWVSVSSTKLILEMKICKVRFNGLAFGEALEWL